MRYQECKDIVGQIGFEIKFFGAVGNYINEIAEACQKIGNAIMAHYNLSTFDEAKKLDPTTELPEHIVLMVKALQAKHAAAYKLDEQEVKNGI